MTYLLTFAIIANSVDTLPLQEDPQWLLEDGQITYQEAKDLQEREAENTVEVLPVASKGSLRTSILLDSAHAPLHWQWAGQAQYLPWNMEVQGDSVIRRGSLRWIYKPWELGVGSWETHQGAWVKRDTPRWNFQSAMGLDSTILACIGLGNWQIGSLWHPRHSLAFAAFQDSLWLANVHLDPSTQHSLVRIQGQGKWGRDWIVQQQFLLNGLDSAEPLLQLTQLERQSHWIYTSNLKHRNACTLLQWEERWQASRDNAWEERSRASWTYNTKTGFTKLALSIQNTPDSILRASEELQAVNNILRSSWSGIGGAQWKQSPQNMPFQPRLQCGVSFLQKPLFQMKFLIITPAHLQEMHQVTLRFQAQGEFHKNVSWGMRWTLQPWGTSTSAKPTLLRLTWSLQGIL